MDHDARGTQDVEHDRDAASKTSGWNHGWKQMDVNQGGISHSCSALDKGPWAGRRSMNYGMMSTGLGSPAFGGGFGDRWIAKSRKQRTEGREH